jgi:hypothetical protein
MACCGWKNWRRPTARSGGAHASSNTGVKFRGGYHDVTITTGGLNVFPRLVARDHDCGDGLAPFVVGLADHGAICFAARASAILQPGRDKTTRRANHLNPCPALIAKIVRLTRRANQ